MSRRHPRLPRQQAGSSLSTRTSAPPGRTTALRPIALAVHIAAAGIALGTTTFTPSALAQQGTTEQARRYSIPAGSLNTVLNRFAEEAGVLLGASGSLTAGKTSAGLNGSYGVQAGFATVLAGSGLDAFRQADGSYGLRAAAVAASSQDDVSLKTVTVSGKAPGSTTEGTGSYTTWSTSSSTRLNLSQQETPQAVTVLTRQRLDDQKLDTLVDALEATAGIIVQRTTYGQDSPTIYARGSILRNYQIDGVPVFYTMSPFLANTAAFDRIEIVRGATGIMNGLGSPAATVNMIRKRPTAETKVALTTEAGSWNRHGAGIDVSGALNEDKSLRGRLVADYKHQNAWVDRYKQKGLTLYGIAELDLGRDTLLTAGFSHLSQDTDSAIQGRPIYARNGARMPITAADNSSQPWRFYDHKTTTAFTSIEHRLGRGWVAKAEYSHTKYQYEGMVASFLAAADVSGVGSTTYPGKWASEPEQDNLDAYVTGAFPLLGRTHEVIAGVTLARLKATGASYARDPSYNVNVNYYSWADIPEPAFTQSVGSTSRERQENAFVSTRLSVTDNTNLLLGGRLTHWQNSGTSSGTPYVQKENVFVPYVGVVHALNDTWSVYGSYTKIFRPQQYYVIEFNRAPADAEEGVGYEAGIKASFLDGRLTSSLSLFQTDLKNLAVWNLSAYRYDILGQTRTRGVELELNGELAKNWQLTAGYALSQSEDASGKRVLTYVPRNSLKLFSSYRLPGEWNQLTLGGGINWLSEMRSGEAINHREPGVALVNLMARYQVDKNLSVALNLNNALDKRYLSTVASNFGTYGPPRNLMLSAKYSF